MSSKIFLVKWTKINDYIINWIDKTILSWNRKVLQESVTCICWKTLFVRKDHLISWRTKNCWCKRTEIIRNVWLKNKKHWMEWTKFYIAFWSAKYRCNNENSRSYRNYGLRWIKCEWETFEEFYNDMYTSYLYHISEFWTKNTSLDRIDNDWNYCKENCRWATWKIQQNNKRSNRLLEYRWEIKTLSQLEELWFWKRIVSDRLNSWWDIERAINKIPRKRK
jgi:hypothetical protein